MNTERVSGQASYSL